MMIGVIVALEGFWPAVGMAFVAVGAAVLAVAGTAAFRGWR
jgi:hypothetical protein